MTQVTIAETDPETGAPEVTVIETAEPSSEASTDTASPEELAAAVQIAAIEGETEREQIRSDAAVEIAEIHAEAAERNDEQWRALEEENRSLRERLTNLETTASLLIQSSPSEPLTETEAAETLEILDPEAEMISPSIQSDTSEATDETPTEVSAESAGEVTIAETVVNVETAPPEKRVRWL